MKKRKKYSQETKLRIVKDYRKGKGSVPELTLKYGITSQTAVYNWIYNYKRFGEKGLEPLKKQMAYTTDFKEFMVKCYLESNSSYHEVCLKNGMTNPSLLGKWVREYRKRGILGLTSLEEERALVMNHKKPKKQVSTSKKSNKNKSPRELELEQRILDLEIENAYLKELRRLRLEETRKMNKLRESSIVSEKPSD